MSEDESMREIGSRIVHNYVDGGAKANFVFCFDLGRRISFPIDSNCPRNNGEVSQAIWRPPKLSARNMTLISLVVDRKPDETISSMDKQAI
jgi:hypothetical protein